MNDLCIFPLDLGRRHGKFRRTALPVVLQIAFPDRLQCKFITGSEQLATSRKEDAVRQGLRSNAKLFYQLRHEGWVSSGKDVLNVPIPLFLELSENNGGILHGLSVDRRLQQDRDLTWKMSTPAQEIGRHLAIIHHDFLDDRQAQHLLLRVTRQLQEFGRGKTVETIHLVDHKVQAVLVATRCVQELQAREFNRFRAVPDPLQVGREVFQVANRVLEERGVDVGNKSRRTMCIRHVLLLLLSLLPSLDMVVVYL